MNINKHLLEGEAVTREESPNQSGEFAASLPDTIVMHYTGGGSLEGSVQWLRNPVSKASAHVVIGRDGAIVQLVPFNKVAWHAGKSTWKGRSGLNKYSIGIEMDNAGVLTRSGGKYITSFGKTIPAAEVMEARHRNETTAGFWHTYTEKQVMRARELCALLIDTYGISEIVGHEEIAPGRKTDPGPAFPLDQFREALIDNPRAGEGPHELPAAGSPATVASGDGLNIRAGAGAQYDAISNPLPKGQTVVILEEKDGWARVRTSIEGWVSARYLKKG